MDTKTYLKNASPKAKQFLILTWLIVTVTIMSWSIFDLVNIIKDDNINATFLNVSWITVRLFGGWVFGLIVSYILTLIKVIRDTNKYEKLNNN